MTRANRREANGLWRSGTIALAILLLGHARTAVYAHHGFNVRSGIEQSSRDARPPLPGETTEDWVMLGTKLHGGFGSYIALGVHIGLDAREQLWAEPRTLDVTVLNGPNAPCACIADGLQLSTGATPGRSSITVLPGTAGPDVFAEVTVTDRASGRRLRYTVPAEARELLDQWNKIPVTERLAALRTVPSIELYARAEIGNAPPADAEALSLLGVPLKARPATPAVAEAVARLGQAPQNPEALLAAGQAYDTVWQFRAAIDLYTRALAVAPDSVRALSYRGQRWISTRQFDRALADLTRAAALDGTSFDALYHLGLTHYMTGRFGDAAAAFARCLDTPPSGSAQPVMGHSPSDVRHCGALSDGLRFALISWRYAALIRAGRSAEADALLAGAPVIPRDMTEGRYYAEAVGHLRSPRPIDLKALPAGTPALTLGYPLANAAFERGDRAAACAVLRDLAARDEWPAFGRIAAEADVAAGRCGAAPGRGH